MIRVMVAMVGGEQGGQGEQQEDRGEAQHRVDATHQHGPDGAAVESRDGADHGADQGADQHGGEADRERDAPGHHQPRQLVASERIAAEDVRSGEWRLEAVAQVDLQIVVGQQMRTDGADQHEEHDGRDAEHRQPVAAEPAQGTPVAPPSGRCGRREPRRAHVVPLMQPGSADRPPGRRGRQGNCQSAPGPRRTAAGPSPRDSRGSRSNPGTAGPCRAR